MYKAWKAQKIIQTLTTKKVIKVTHSLTIKTKATAVECLTMANLKISNLNNENILK